MIYLVTGASGFLGNVLMRELLRRGEKVIGFARSEQKCKEIFGSGIPSMVYGDIRDESALKKLFECGEEFSVLHTAAVVSIGGAREARTMREVNIVGTENVLRLCKEFGAKRLVYVSSVHALPEKNMKGRTITEIESFDARAVIGGYAETKAITSQMVLDAAKDGLDAVIVHPSAILGPGDFGNTFMSQMMIDFAEGRIPASVRGGFDFVDVRDAADGILRACAEGRKGECYLLTGHIHTVTEVLGMVAAETDRKTPLTLPMWTARAGLPFLAAYSKLFRKRPLYTRYALYTLGSNYLFSHEKAERELGFLPRATEDTIRDAIAFFRARGLITPKAAK